MGIATKWFAFRRVAALLATFTFASGCSNDKGNTAGAGGASGTAGMSAGGATSGSAGMNGAGTPGAGGAPADSGVPAPRFDVMTASGPVTGTLQKKTRVFFGIPYAAPPTGANRWRAPQPVTPWTAARDATVRAKVCPQIAVAGTDVDPRSDEDCLTLNVWTPDPKPAAPLSVMVWIHGGAFFFGSGAEPFYDGDQIVTAGNVVLVTINYRIGALGFLALPALTKEDPAHPTSGNYGFEDQQAAMMWVKNNIAAFGGDPSRVTIFGESAGGYSVCAHLIAPKSQGLFIHAIAESGFCSGYFGSTLDAAYPNSEALARNIGCTDASKTLECLRAKTPSDILHLYDSQIQLPGGLFFQVPEPYGDGGVQGSQLAWKPVTDGVVIPSKITEVGASFPKVPLIIGTNADEGTLFTALFGGKPAMTEDDYRAAVTRVFGAGHTDAILQQYPVSEYPTANDALNAVSNDAMFACPARRLARDVSTKTDVYLYAFHHKPLMSILPTLGSFHAAELAYIFGYDTPLTVTQESEKPLGDAMRGYWTRFAKAGDPNGDGAPIWPKYSAATDQNIGLDLPAPMAEANYKKALCDFWDSIYML